MYFLKALLFFLLLVCCGCGKQSGEHPSGPPPVEVSTYKVEPRDIPAEEENVGVALSSHEVEIRSQVQGYLQKVAYKEGEMVEKGQLLFQIDPRPYQAVLDGVKAELDKQQAMLWDASKAVERLEPLFKENAASRRDYESAVAQKLALEASVESAKAKVREAELNREYTSIRAPISGLTGQSKFREGALITPSSMMTIISVINPIWVQFALSESAVLKMAREIENKSLVYPENEEFEVEVTLADGSRFPVKGKVHFTSPTYEQSTGTLMEQATLPNPQGTLLPGQFVRVTVLGWMRPNAIAIPQRAIQQSQKGTFVYVVTKEGTAAIRYVETGDWYQDLWIIQSGLEQGDEVIVNGVNKIGPGSPVIVKNESESKPKKDNHS